MGIGFGLGGIVLLIAILVISSFRILPEYERGCVFMRGRFCRVSARTAASGPFGALRS